MDRAMEIKDLLDVVDAGLISGVDIIEAYKWILSKIQGNLVNMEDRTRIIELESLVRTMEKDMQTKHKEDSTHKQSSRLSVIVHTRDYYKNSLKHGSYDARQSNGFESLMPTLRDPKPGSSRREEEQEETQEGAHIQSGCGEINVLRKPLQYFEIAAERTKFIRKFHITGKTLLFKFKSTEESTNPITWLQNAFSEILRYTLEDTNPADRVGLVLRNENFPEKPVGVSFRRADQLSGEVIMQVLEKILQSNSAFFANDLLQLQVDKVSLPVGYGRVMMTGSSFEDFCRRKPGILPVENNDNLCLARALVLAIAWRQHDPNFKELQKRGSELMLRKAEELCRVANVDITNGGHLDHIIDFQNYLVRFSIVVYNSRIGATVYFEGPRTPDRVVLNLILEQNHFNVIISLTSAFSTSYFCELCKTRSSNKTQHKNCKYICPACHSKTPCNKNFPVIKCDQCNRDFRGTRCFIEHKKLLCDNLKRCLTCLHSVWTSKRSKHQCGYKYCSMCQTSKPIRHLCYMTKKKFPIKTLDRDFIFVFYDLECRQDSLLPGSDNIYLHEATLCVSQQVCKYCINVVDNGQDTFHDCPFCGAHQKVFKVDPVNEFLNYLSELNKLCEVIAIAHNAKGYDAPFILKAVLKEVGRWNPKVISNGTKLMSIKCNRIKFIDSLNYMPMPLSKLPKTFNFKEIKGFFPHFFNKIENQNYVGPLPARHYYGADEMSPEVRNEFILWHTSEEARGVVFDFQNEILKYCISDVTILRKACVEFWKRFTVANKVDPFRESCTIAGSCNLVFRRNFITDQSIGILPPNGYRMADRQSKIALQWLIWLEHSLGTQIKHYGNSREIRLREGILVDGFCEQTNTVYQFNGCYFHGCEVCFPDQTVQLGNDKNDSMLIRRERTEAQAMRIRSYNYNLVEMKECDFRRLLINDIQASAYLAAHPELKNHPLNPRDSFFGGRTNAIKLYCEASEGVDIKYFDVCSLYPFVNKYGKYPVGHPRLHVGNDACRKLSIDAVEGIVKCTVLPPYNLYHPVLPVRMHGKLMFILCKTCGETLFDGDCTHTDNQRKFCGTYVADELRKAISRGYKILEVQEIWEYEIAHYDKISKSGGLFSKYVDNFLKTKQECSGWPNKCTDEQSKEEYILKYYEREGIRLDQDKIELNSGMRYISKLCLNSFWGKFAQRENLMQTSIISDPSELFKKISDPSVNPHSLIYTDDSNVILNWDRPDEGIEPLNTVNVVIAAYTTANARLVLYEYLDKLGDRVLYFDTDSVIFTQRFGEWAPEPGDFLGDMTNEVECYGPGSKIVEYVSGGPKNYALKIFSTNKQDWVFVCKVKGITLNYKNLETVNFDRLKDMILNDAPATYVHTDRKISRLSTYNVVSKPERKIFQVKYTKRQRLNDSYDTIPFGYRTE